VEIQHTDNLASFLGSFPAFVLSHTVIHQKGAWEWGYW